MPVYQRECVQCGVCLPPTADRLLSIHFMSVYYIAAAAADAAAAEIESFVFIALKVTCTQFYYVYKYK